MNRIKLPGKEKHKKMLLVVLVIITVGILFYEHNMNIKEQERKAQEQIEKTSGMENEQNKEGSVITGESQTIKESNGESNSNKESNVSKDEGKEHNSANKEVKAKKTYTAKENELYNQAYSLFFSHDYKGAINTANDLVSQFGDNPMGYNIRGIAKAYNGDYKTGMADIDKALQLDDTYGYARFNKALTYELYGNMEEALKWYNKDLEVEEYVWTYYGIASIYGRRGEVDNTMKYLNKAIQMDSEVKESAKEEHDFDPVKNSEAFKEAVYK